MRNSEYIPKEQLDARPEVFSRKSFPDVLRFALRYDRLRIPISEVDGISANELAHVSSLSEIRELVEERVGKTIRKELSELFLDAEAQKRWKPKDIEFLIKATTEGSFENAVPERNALYTTALGLSLVAERARTETMSRAFEALGTENLERFGISPSQKVVMQGLLSAIPKLNAEYLRHRIHIRDKNPYSDQPVDTLRERRFIAKKFSEIAENVEELGKAAPIFGSQEKDGAFKEYMKAIAVSYEPLENGAPLSRDEQKKRMEITQENFLRLHTEFPDFPLIVFPAFSHYEADDASEKDGGEWEDFGFDPEIRLYWQSTEARNKQPAFHAIRDEFAEKIAELYPAIPMENVKKYRVLIGELIAASGINLKEKTTSQEEKNIILMTEGAPDASDRKAEEFLKCFLQDPRDRDIVGHPAFRDLIQRETALHEFGHGLYPEASEAADALGDRDDDLCEKKSDIAMWALAVPLLKDFAEEHFPGSATRAIQLALLYDALRLWRGVGGSDPAYDLSSFSVLDLLEKEGVLVERDGKPIVETTKLDEDLSGRFRPELGAVLQVYQKAASGFPKNIREAKDEARACTVMKPTALLKKIKKL